MSCHLAEGNILHDTLMYRVVYDFVCPVLPAWLSYLVAGLAIMIILVNMVLLGAAVFVWAER